MKKLITVLVVGLLIGIIFSPAIAAESNEYSMGPAPNSGDGDPDGSGFNDLPPDPDTPENPFGPGGEDGPKGPAPNSGDGDPDGSGF